MIHPLALGLGDQVQALLPLLVSAAVLGDTKLAIPQYSPCSCG